jgi:hypothetical protein
MDDIEYTLYRDNSDQTAYAKFILDSNGDVKSVKKLNDVSPYVWEGDDYKWNGTYYARFSWTDSTGTNTNVFPDNDDFWISESSTNSNYEYKGYYTEDTANLVKSKRKTNSDGEYHTVTWPTKMTEGTNELWAYGTVVSFKDPPIKDWYAAIEKEAKEGNNTYTLYQLPIDVTASYTSGSSKGTTYSRTVYTGFAYDLTKSSGGWIDSSYIACTKDPTWGNITVNRHNGTAYVFLGKGTVAPTVTYQESWTSSSTYQPYLVSDTSTKTSGSTENILQWNIDTQPHTMNASKVFAHLNSGTLSNSYKETLTNTKINEPDDYYIAIEKKDDDGYYLNGVPFEISIQSNDSADQKTLLASKYSATRGLGTEATDGKATTNIYTGMIHSRKDSSTDITRTTHTSGGSTTLNGKTVSYRNGLTVLYLGKYYVAPTVTYRESWSTETAYIVTKDQTTSGTPTTRTKYQNTIWSNGKDITPHKNAIPTSGEGFTTETNVEAPVNYYIAVKKTSGSDILINVPFKFEISGKDTLYESTNDKGIALFTIPTSYGYTDDSAPTGTLTELSWNSTAGGRTPTTVWLNQKDNDHIVQEANFVSGWTKSGCSTYSSPTDAQTSAHLFGADNPKKYPYYAKIIKKDEHGNVLEGVPFKVNINGAGWSETFYTNSKGERLVQTSAIYTDNDEAPKIKWEEQEWGNNVVYLHVGSTAEKKEVDNNDYIVKNDIPEQTMSKSISSPTTYTHTNEKYQHYDVSIKKKSLGELTNVDMSGTIYEIGVLNGTKFTSIGEFTLKKDGTPSKFDTVGTVSDGVIIEQLTHNSVVYAHISVPETDADNIAIIEGTGTKQLAIREKQANANHEKNTKTSPFALVENSDEQHYKVLDYENYEALGDNQKISLIFNIKKSPKAGSQSLSMEGVQYGVFTTENATNASKIATFTMGADGTVSEVNPNKTSVGGFTIGTDETHKYLTISIADGNTTPIIQRITTGLYIQETKGNKFYEKNDEVIPINMEDLTVNQEVTLQPNKYGILYEEARVPVYAALIKYVTDPAKDLKDNPLNGVPFDITIKNGTNIVFTANASGTPDAPTSGVWTGYLYDAVKGQYYDIKEHANNGTAQTGNVVFTLTVKDGTTISNVQTSTNQDVTQNITRKDGLAVVYLGLIKESNLPKYTVNITENWNTLNNVAYAVKKVNSEITMVSEQGTDFKNMWSGNITLKTNGIPENPEKVTNRSSSVKVKIVKTPKVENDSQLQKILNNPNYSLDGATYAIYRKNGNAYTKVKDVVLTESNDKRSAMAIYDISDDFFANDNINPVTYYIREEKGGHNYSIHNPITNGGYYTLTVTKPDDDENEKIFTLEEVSDPVEEDPVQFTISKRHKQSDKPVRPEHGDDDAVIKLSYYNMEVVDNKITSTDLPTNPTSTENITLTWDEETKTYKQTSTLTEYQMGYLTISEIEPPTGYKKEGNIININIGSKTYSWKYPDTPVFVFKRRTDGDTTLTNPVADIRLFVWTDDGLQQIDTVTSADIDFKVDFLEETEITPTFGSNAITTTTNSQLGVIANSTTIKDTIWCKDVQNGNTYTYRASLYDITDSKDITKLTALKTVSYTYESNGRAKQDVLNNGETPFVFNINSSGLAGHTLAVAVEVIGKDNVVYYTHNTDFSDTNQTISYPSITTVANGVSTTKVGKIATNDVITDKISYSNFPVGTKIKLKGQLIDLNESATSEDRIAGTYTSPNDITVTKDDTTTISYTVDSTKRKGHKLTSVVTAFITTPDGTVDIITHNSAMNIADETVYYPNTRSELLTSNGTQMGVLNANETARERVYFSNIPQGITVTVSAELYDITNGTPSKFGNTLTEQRESNGLSEQYVDITFNYNATDFAGKTLTAVAKINIGNDTVISHNTDYSIVSETIYYPKFDTVLSSSSTGTKLASISTNEFASDKVTFKNVPQGTKLTFVGELWNMKTNTKIALKNGDATDNTQVTYTMPNGSAGLGEQEVTIPFNYDATGLEGVALSAKTYVKLGDTQITVHNNGLTDVNEQIRYMAFNTELLSKYPNNTTNKVGIVNKTETESEFAEETVTFSGVPVETVVTYYAELRDKTANNSLVTLKNDTTDGTNDNILVVDAPASTKLTAQSFKITFEYNSKNLAGHTLSAKVTAMLNGKVVGVHNEDLTDEEETIYYLNGQTSASDVKTTTKLGSKTSTTKIYDDFIFTNAVKGVHYTMNGTVHQRTKDGKDGGPLMNGTNPITKNVEFWIGDDNKIHTTNADQDNSSATMTSDTTASGKVRVVFDIDTRLLNGITTTVFETISVEGIDIFVHENINDRNQQVHFMELTTDISDNATATNIGALVEQEVVQDRLIFEKVPFGTEIKFDGVLKYKDGTNVGLEGTTSSVTLTVGNMGSVSTSSGVATEVTGVSDRNTNTVSGTIVLTYKYNSTTLANKTLVSCVTATHNGETVDIHTDLNDERETIYYPSVHTNANDANTLSNVAKLGNTQVIDTVTVNNLALGHTYKVSGSLHKKDNAQTKIGETKEATIAINADGSVITVDGKPVTTLKVTNNAVSGTIDIIFDIDTSKFLGEDVVVFEDLYYGATKLADHADINDEGQTVHIPDGGTTAMDGQTQDHVGTVLENGTIQLPDTVHLTNIACGHTYYIEGILMDKATGESLKVGENNAEVKANATFTVSADGKTITPKNNANKVTNLQDGEHANTVSFDIVLNFEVTSKELHDKDIVVFEKGYFVKSATENVEIFKEENIDDLGQTVHFPGVSTIATDDTYKDHVGITSETESITEKSILTNLVFGMEYEVTATVMNQITNQPIMNGSTPVSKTVVVKTKEDGTIEYVKVKDTDTTLEYKVTAKRTNTYDITIDIPIVFNSIGANGSSIVLFEDLKHNNVIVKSHHELEDTDEQIHYFELILYKEGLDNPTIAEFKIEQNNTQMKFKALTDGSYAIASDGTLTTLHPNTKGVIVIRGFNADPYTITEIKTASGKNMLTQPVNVQFISDTSDADNIIRGLKVSMKDEKGREYTAIINPTDETKPYSIELNVTNNDSIKLMTGGHGTYMFYFFGLTLLIFAMGIFMIYRRKRH